MITSVGILVPFAVRDHLWWMIGSNPDAAGLTQLLSLLGIFAVGIFAVAYICETLLRLHRDPVRPPAVRRLHPVPSARAREVALRCRLALGRPDRGHLHEQVIGD